MRHTQFTHSNVALLIAGLIVSVINLFIVVMTGAFATDPVHDLRSFVTAAFVSVSLLIAPIYLIMLRCCGIGAIAMWRLVGGCCLFALLAGIFFELFVLEGLLVIQALIFGAINSRSRTPTVDLTSQE
jgi:hypothetical protein